MNLLISVINRHGVKILQDFGHIQPVTSYVLLLEKREIT